jgi:hypothetical protein
MQEWIKDRENKLREFFRLAPEAEILPREAARLEVPTRVAEHLAQFNLEWHIVPPNEIVPLGEEYRKRLYPMLRLDPQNPDYKKTASYQAITAGHQRHQGRIIAVETTPKPRYLPGNRQLYGTPYGFEDRADPFAAYWGRGNFANGTRYGHDYTSLRKLIDLINEDWRAQGLMPLGFRLTICPPVVFNLIGTIFHPEWSQTESLEIGFYRDAHGSAKCYAVGSSAPGDFSYIREIETNSEWTWLGFRIVLVPE